MGKTGENTQLPEYSPVAQITMAKIGCKPKEAIKQDKTVFMCRVFGEAVQLKTKEARSGDMYSYLLGEFRAVNSDGAKFETEKLFLPGGILESIETALKSSGDKPVQFAYDIFA